MSASDSYDQGSTWKPGNSIAAFLIDPDGNNIEAVHHGEAERSADVVKITFSWSALTAPSSARHLPLHLPGLCPCVQLARSWAILAQ